MACESEQEAVTAAEAALSKIRKHDQIHYFKTDSKVRENAHKRLRDAKSALFRCRNKIPKKKTGGFRDSFLEAPIEEL